MPHKTFRSELEEKENSIVDIIEHDGMLMVEYRSDVRFGGQPEAPGICYGHEYGRELVSTLTGEDAEEGGADPGHNIAVWE